MLINVEVMQRIVPVGRRNIYLEVFVLCSPFVSKISVECFFLSSDNFY